MTLRLLAAAAIAALAPTQALAASSTWHDSAGGRVRLVTSGPVSDAGELRGALVIELKPGWKTYWRDPGASGVPPQFEPVRGSGWKSVEMSFPAPSWHRDDYGSWAGYDRSVAFPVTFRTEPGQSPVAVEGAAFLGICQTICVPLQADLILTIDRASTPAEDNSVVEAAWSALPGKPTEKFGIVGTAKDDEGALVVEVASTTKPVQLFVAGEGYVIAPPRPVDDRHFSVKIITYPKHVPEGPGLDYTLSGPDGAVSGIIAHPRQ